jgi:hypothetical protein
MKFTTKTIRLVESFPQNGAIVSFITTTQDFAIFMYGLLIYLILYRLTQRLLSMFASINSLILRK